MVAPVRNPARPSIPWLNNQFGRSPMPTYMSLINFTDQGIRNIKESPKRLDSAKKALQKLGGELKAFYLTQGHYDGVLIFEVPTEAALTQFLLTTGAAGNVR